MVAPMNAQQAQAYKDAVDNLIFLKKQQWQVANYFWIGETALLYLAKLSPTAGQLAFFQFAAALGVVFAVVTLGLLQASMKKFRTRIYYIYHQYFEPEELKKMGVSAQKKGYFHDPIIYLMLNFVCIVAGTLVCIMIEQMN